MTYAEFKQIVKDNYNSVFPNSACTISVGPLGRDSAYITYYLAGDQSEFPNRIALNDLFDITFCVLQDGVGYGDGVKLEDDVEMPEALVLDINHKSIKTAPENKYMAYESVSLPFRKTKGTPDKIIAILKRYAEITKQTLIELYELEKLPTNQHPEIVEFVKDKLGLVESKKVEDVEEMNVSGAKRYCIIIDDFSGKTNTLYVDTEEELNKILNDKSNKYTVIDVYKLDKSYKVESKQVNNMKIKYSKIYDKYQVITPDGRVLEEFDTEKEAIDWASKQKDFVVKKEDIDYISKDELDKMPADYKTTVGDTIKYSWEDKDMLRKKYKDLGYEETDPMILTRDDKLGTVLKPVKVKKDEVLKDSVKVDKNKKIETVEKPESTIDTTPKTNHVHCDNCLEDFEYQFDPLGEVSNDIEIHQKGNDYAYYVECPNCGNTIEVEPEELDLIVINVDDITKNGFYMEVMDRPTGRKCWYEVWREGDDWNWDFNQFIFHLDYDNDIIAKMFQEELSKYAEDIMDFVYGIVEDKKLDELEEAKKPINKKAQKLRELKRSKNK